MGHFALTDVLDQQHYGFGSASAGAQWVWRERRLNHSGSGWKTGSWRAAGPGIFQCEVHAQESGIAIDLTLNAGKPLVLQGDRGLSQKSAESGNASYYYSYTRLPTKGAIKIAEQTFIVQGASWLDREWSTSALGPDQVVPGLVRAAI